MDDITLIERYHASLRPDYEWGFLLFLILLALFAVLAQHTRSNDK